jgi:hypothetical protein
MWAKIETWRLAKDLQEEQAYTRFLRDLSRRNTPILREYGLLDGFVVRVGPDTMMTMNLYETEEQAESAWRNVISHLGDELKGQLSLVERKVGPAEDLPMLLDEV